MTTHADKPLRVLFLCTANSARSQIAEALLTTKGHGRFEVASAGSHPAPRLNPFTVQILRELDIEWTGRAQGNRRHQVPSVGPHHHGVRPGE